MATLKPMATPRFHSAGGASPLTDARPTTLTGSCRFRAQGFACVSPECLVASHLIFLTIVRHLLGERINALWRPQALCATVVARIGVVATDALAVRCYAIHVGTGVRFTYYSTGSGACPPHSLRAARLLRAMCEVRHAPPRMGVDSELESSLQSSGRLARMRRPVHLATRPVPNSARDLDPLRAAHWHLGRP